jgi:hypothetical protein
MFEAIGVLEVAGLMGCLRERLQIDGRFDGMFEVKAGFYTAGLMGCLRDCLRGARQV